MMSPLTCVVQVLRGLTGWFAVKFLTADGCLIHQPPFDVNKDTLPF